MTIWDIVLYLNRHRGKLLLTVLLCAALSCAYIDHIQTYSAEIILRYRDGCIASGLAPDGTRFDPDEIAAPQVAADAGQDLPPDMDVRARTTVTPIGGTSFWVRYRGGSSPAQTQDTLDRLIDRYCQYYTERYARPAAVSEIDYSLNGGSFSPLEQACLLRDNISQTLRILEDYAEDSSYRSPVNGLSFRDLADEFSHLSRFQLPKLYDSIAAGQDVSGDIQAILDRLEELYADTAVLMDGAAACDPPVECLTGIRTYPNVYKAPCALLVTLAGLALSSMAAVVYETAKEHGRRTRPEP